MNTILKSLLRCINVREKQLLIDWDIWENYWVIILFPMTWDSNNNYAYTGHIFSLYDILKYTEIKEWLYLTF